MSPAFKTLFGYSDVTTCACPRGCLHAFPWANEPDLGREPPWGERKAQGSLGCGWASPPPTGAQGSGLWNSAPLSVSSRKGAGQKGCGLGGRCGGWGWTSGETGEDHACPLCPLALIPLTAVPPLTQVGDIGPIIFSVGK